MHTVTMHFELHPFLRSMHSLTGLYLLLQRLYLLKRNYFLNRKKKMSG